MEPSPLSTVAAISQQLPTLQRVLQHGKLTPRVLEVFSSHEAVVDLARALEIQSWTPPLIHEPPPAWRRDSTHPW